MNFQKIRPLALRALQGRTLKVRLHEYLGEKRHEILRVFALGKVGEDATVLCVKRRLREECVAKDFESEVCTKATLCLDEADSRVVARGLHAKNTHSERIARRLVLR